MTVDHQKGGVGFCEHLVDKSQRCGMKQSAFSLAYRRNRYRSWIKSTLAQKNGRAQMHRLEEDIGVPKGFFEEEAKGNFLRDLFQLALGGSGEEQGRPSSIHSDQNH
ncbi:hypothetical protein [Marinobacter manganoxydans]|nr:hypothetical protein [Marinobacter manganoxydans]